MARAYAIGGLSSLFLYFQAEDGIRDLVRSRGLGDVYKRQDQMTVAISGGSGLVSYQWQSSTDGNAPWANAAGLSLIHI